MKNHKEKLIEKLGNPENWIYVNCDTHGGECACGKKNIVYRYHLRNRLDNSMAIVGSECINYFTDTPEYKTLVDADKVNKRKHRWVLDMRQYCNTVLRKFEDTIDPNKQELVAEAKKFLNGQHVSDWYISLIKNYGK